MSLYTEADLARRTGDAARCRRALGEAFRLSRETGVKNPPVWQAARMAELCVIALEAGIEVPFVRDVIRERDLRPAVPPRHLENWPWPLRIYTLGDFAVVRDDERLAFSGKAKRRPLDLLKALIAFGGRGVAVERLKDALWPDADGDMAQQSLDTTLHRLRRLLAVDGALVLAEGRLTLSPLVCWVDVSALQDILAKAGEALKDPSVEPGEIERLQEKALALYRGGFLEHLSDAPWVLSPRSRLALAMARGLHDIGRYWEGRDRADEAAKCYRLAIETDAPSETLSRALRAALRRVRGADEAAAQ
jgi:DNA-binding SARP family transcriptional activator